MRARVIKGWVERAGLAGVVCFSCGNATRELRHTGLYVVDVAPGGSLAAGRWWGADEIRRAWPHLLDATSGHLPPPLMWEVAQGIAAELGPNGPRPGGAYAVMTGSGETITCLRMAYPLAMFTAVYDDGDPATRFDERAPLTRLVVASGPVIRRP